MPDLSTNAYGVMLTALAGAADFLSLHTADPAGVGSNELSGGTPAYARKAITWAAPSGGNLDTNIEVVFNIPPNKTITHVGMWSALTGGTFYGAQTIAGGSEVFTGQGTLRILTGTAGLT